MTQATFTVSADAMYGFIVHEAARAVSFAMVPRNHRWSYETKAEALTQAEALTLQAEVMDIQTRMIETPDRFEAVQDTRYGAAW